MQRLGTGLAAAAIMAAAFPHLAEANAIRRACLKSDRAAVSRSLCTCIQNVANATLSRSEQRRGAKFFANPQELQDLKQSSSSRNSRFLKNWKNFGTAARNSCN